MSETTAADYDRTDYDQGDRIRVRLEMSEDNPFERVSVTGVVTSTGVFSGVLTIDAAPDSPERGYTVKLYADGRADVIDHAGPSRDHADLVSIREVERE